MQKSLLVLVCSYSGEWVDAEGNLAPSEAIQQYLRKIGKDVTEWMDRHPGHKAYVVANGGIIIDGQYEAEVVYEYLWRLNPGLQDRVSFVLQKRSWTTPTDLICGLQEFAYHCGLYHLPPPYLEDPEKWEVMVACATAYETKTRNLARYLLGGREVESIVYPVGGTGAKIRLKQKVSRGQDSWSFSTGLSYGAKNRKRMKQIRDTPGLQPPELLERLV